VGLRADYVVLGSVKVKVNGGPAQPEVRTLPAHKKNPEVGDKKTVFASELLMEQVDAESFGDNEEVSCPVLSGG
jgi:glutamyl-tRNA synthetase